jgi:predicted PurR-regulated permease PerM
MQVPESIEVSPVTSREKQTLTILAGVLSSGALALVFDFWLWLVLAIWTASLTKPLATRLLRRAGGRTRAAALITIGLLLALWVPLGAGIAVLIPDVIELVQRARSSEPGSSTLVELVSKRSAEDPKKQQPAEPKPPRPTEPKSADAPAPGPQETPKPDTVLSSKPEQLIDMAKQHGQQAMTYARPIVGALGRFALGVFVFFVGVYAALLHGEAAYAWVRERLPLSPASIDRLRDTYLETGRGLLYSVGLTALLQGGLATIAYVSLGVPRALALGLATIITSLIPAIGPFLVWGPVAGGLFLAGHPIKAAILAGVGVIVVAPADNLLRPLLAARGKLQLHPFLVFFSMLGGIALLGGWGLVVGPLVFRMAREVIEMAHEQRAADSGAPAAHEAART